MYHTCFHFPNKQEPYFFSPSQCIYLLSCRVAIWKLNKTKQNKNPKPQTLKSKILIFFCSVLLYDLAHGCFQLSESSVFRVVMMDNWLALGCLHTANITACRSVVTKQPVMFLILWSIPHYLSTLSLTQHVPIRGTTSFGVQIPSSIGPEVLTARGPGSPLWLQALAGTQLLSLWMWMFNGLNG